MLGRNFVSLYFLPDKLLITQLSSNKKKLQKYATIDLPKELIKDYKVADIDALSKILKTAWSKFSIKEKAVGIILPEFSTFTKFFKLPHLQPAELNEAVRWQAQEYLPTAVGDSIMDWKIARQEKGALEILIIAAEKKVLSGYVYACEKAELFPLVVETPSICLVRTVRDDKGTIIVYLGPEETTLVLSQGTEITGTSVIHSGIEGEVVKTASRMISHYKQINVESVLVGGIRVDDNLVAKLEEKLKLKAEKIKLDIGGAEEKVIQEYLVPIFMQLQDPAEPADPLSLNLLPAELVQKYKSAKTRLQIWSLTLTVTLFVWISFLVTLVTYLFMVQQINDVSTHNQSRAEISRRRENVARDVAGINQVAEKVNNIREIYIYPQSVLNQINASLPQGVSISQYSLDFDKNIVSLTGTAVDRQSLVSFRANLENLEEIDSVSIPISSFEAETNLEFSLSFEYQPKNTDSAAQEGGR